MQLTYPPYIGNVKYLTSSLPPDLGKLSHSLDTCAAKVGFFHTCMESQGPLEIQHLQASSHSTAELANHVETHGGPIFIPRGMNSCKWKMNLAYGAYASESKEVEFVHTELV